MAYVTQEYLERQFKNYSNAVKNTFTKKTDMTAEKLSYTNADEADIDNVKEALDLLFEEGGGILESPITANVQIGQVTNGKTYPVGTPLETILREILTEQLPPSVNMVISPSKTLYNIVTESIPSLAINCTVTKKSNDVSKIEYFINDTLVHTVTSGVTDGGTFPYVYNTEIKKTTTIKVVVTDSEGLSATSTKKIEFYPVIYYGILDANTSTATEQMIKTLNTKLQNTKVFTYENITTDWGKVCVCVPKMLGNITSIFDPINNLSYNSTFETSTVSCNGYDYTVLKQIDASAASGITLKFS